MKSYFYHPQTKLLKGNVFTGVCSQVGISDPMSFLGWVSLVPGPFLGEVCPGGFRIAPGHGTSGGGGEGGGGRGEVNTPYRTGTPQDTSGKRVVPILLENCRLTFVVTVP